MIHFRVGNIQLLKYFGSPWSEHCWMDKTWLRKVPTQMSARKFQVVPKVLQSLARENHDTVNCCYKKVSMLGTRFRHHKSLRSVCFHAVANLNQLMLFHEEVLFKIDGVWAILIHLTITDHKYIIIFMVLYVENFSQKKAMTRSRFLTSNCVEVPLIAS